MVDPSSLIPSEAQLSTLGIAVSNTNYLRIYSWGSLSGLTLALNWRLEHQGKVGPIQSQQYTADSGRTSGGSPKSFQLGAVGVLTTVSVSVQAGTPSRGQCYVKVELRDDSGESGSAQSAIAIKLISGYIVTGRDLVAPFDEDPNSGPGFVYNAQAQVYTGALSTAMASVPVNARWSIRSWATYLSASTVAQATPPQFYIKDSAGNKMWYAPLSPSGGPANARILFQVTPGYPVATDSSVDANNNMRIHGKANWANPGDGGLPAGWLLVGSILITTGVVFAGSAPLWVEEWIVPA